MRSIIIGLIGVLPFVASRFWPPMRRRRKPTRRPCSNSTMRRSTRRTSTPPRSFSGRTTSSTIRRRRTVSRLQGLPRLPARKIPGLAERDQARLADGDYVILHVHSVREKGRAAAPSSTFSGSRTARSSNTGTSCRRFRRRPPTPTACSNALSHAHYRLLFPSRGMHLRVRSTPVAVICEPWTSLICPAGHDPSSTMTRWPSRRSAMSCSRENVCAKAAVATSDRWTKPVRQGNGRDGFIRRQFGLPHLVLIFSPSGPTLICRPSGSFLV